MSFFKKTIWPCVTVIVVCIAWVFVNGDKVVENMQSYQAWYGSSKALEGQWDNSSEYDIDPPTWLTEQNELVKMRLTITDSIVNGAVMSDKLSSLIPLEYVLLSGGKRSFRDTLDAYAFDYVMGKKVYFGSFVIHRDGEKLIVEADDIAQRYFPKKSILIKKSDVAFPELKNKKGNSDEDNGEAQNQPPIGFFPPDKENSK